MKPHIVPEQFISHAEWQDDYCVVAVHVLGQSIYLAAERWFFDEWAEKLDDVWSNAGMTDEAMLVQATKILRLVFTVGIRSWEEARTAAFHAWFLMYFSGNEEDTAEQVYSAAKPTLHVSLDEFRQVHLRVEDAALIPSSPAAGEPDRPRVH